jgi:hypothetical protein
LLATPIVAFSIFTRADVEPARREGIFETAQRQRRSARSGELLK